MPARSSHEIDPSGAGSPRSSFRIELFGKFRIARGTEQVTTVNTSRLQSLLSYLILHGDTPHSREHLAFVLWPDSGESQARTNLRQLLHHLRRALPQECGLMIADNQTLQWRLDPGCTVDVLEFDAAIIAADNALKTADVSEELEALEEAARLYKDDLLLGLYDDWLAPRREHYRQSAAQALVRLASLFERRKDYPPAIRYAERVVAMDPIRESHHQFLIRLHAENADRAAALRTYHQCMKVLRRELGVEPSIATRELFERVLKSDGEMSFRPALPPTTMESRQPLVGRKKEWERLVDFWNAASAGGIQFAVISGEPGIGKSRLAEELYLWCTKQGASQARARCYAAQGHLAYSPVAEWLRCEPLRAARQELPQSQIGQLARVLPEILVENPSIPRPEPLAERWERGHFYDALTAVLQNARKPLLLLIDDLQWCDEDSFEFLHFLFRSPPEGALMVLGTVRIEETGRDHPFSKLNRELLRSGRITEIALSPLGPSESAELGCQIAKRQLTPAELTRLYGATQGNPLFVVESVRYGFGEASQTTPPPRVHAVIAARLAQLSKSAYELAGLAGAIGRAFSLDLLAKATDWDEDSLSQALDELWQRRIIEGKGTATYDFTHDRLREVAYAELSPIRRRAIHRRIARALKELHTDDISAVSNQLAAHYEAGEMLEEAVGYYRDAARVARQQYADREAAVALRRAIALCRGLPPGARRKEQELELLVALGRVLFTTLGYAAPEVGETSAGAVALFRELDANKQRVPVLSSAWVFHTVRGEIEVAKQIGEELLQQTDDGRNAISSLAGNFILGSVCFHLSQFEQSIQHMQQALRYHETCTPADLALFATPEIGGFCRAYIAHLLWLTGHPDAALRQGEEAVLAASSGHPFGLTIALTYAAILRVFRREAQEALLLAEQAFSVCTRYDFPYYRSMAEIVAGWSRVMLGDGERGLSDSRRGLDALRATGAELRLPFYHALLAEASMQAGNTRDALANISSGLAFQSKNGESWAAPYLLQVHGDLLLQDGAAEQARASFQRALDLARQTHSRSFALRAAVRLCRMSPHDCASGSVLREILGEFAEGFDTPDLIEARVEPGINAHAAKA
jgi:DNA-binding SARP family transcriptional activator